MPMYTNEVLVENTVAIPVSGTVAVSAVGGSVAVTGPLTDTQLRATPVPISGTVSVGAPSTIATVTSVSVGSVTAVTLSASNAAKTRVFIHNDNGTLFVKYGTAASTISYTARLTTNTAFEIVGYAGLVTAIKQSGTTAVLVTEVGI